MKILLDHNLDRRLKNHLTDYKTATTQEQNWADVLNGELLTLAEENGFDVLLTADTNIKSQQNLSNRRISILVFRAFIAVLRIMRLMQKPARSKGADDSIKNALTSCGLLQQRSRQSEIRYNNRLVTHAEMIEDIHKALAKIQPGEIVEVLHKDVKAKLK